ncbi:MAG: ABC transporter permease [Kiritimatiellae bacterium]|nr:ABC transporter permease [Kiritimatiellia bacterium]
MKALTKIGAFAVAKARSAVTVTAAVWGILRVACKPGTWPRTSRNVLARQVLFTGFEATRFVSLLAVAVGLSIVVQAQVWLAKVGQTAFLGPVLVMVVIREVGPLLVNFVIIGRSGTAIATELGNMKIAGEVYLLDGQGLDPFTYLVVPRAVGAAISIFCLTVVFILVSFVSGYVSGWVLQANPGPVDLFVNSVFRAIRPADAGNLFIKTILPGLTTGAICCIEGLSVHTAVTEVPQAATRAVVRSTIALFIVSALVSVVTYL